ncbi:hypothetical protein [Syntrophomonas curvata]
MFYNDGYELNENGKALKCPICENEEMWERGEFCRICGKFVVNSCTYCDTIAAGNSRYCELCGAETTFFKHKYLENWQTAKAKIEGREAPDDDWASLTDEIDLDEIEIVTQNPDDFPF